MEKIAVTGGKGGTGKSTVAVMLALDLVEKGNKVILCDCDVECPNDYLLVGKRLNPIKEVFIELPKIIREKCKKCGLCVKACRNNAIFQAPGEYPVIIKDLCSGCGACEEICPYKAIGREKEKIGNIHLNKIKQNLFLITGEANPGLKRIDPVVSQAKEFAIDFAKKENFNIIIFDTAAGTHCPVVSAILGCDIAYCVTEPTPMGASDLKLILNLCKKLNVPTKIILNKADMGDKSLIKEVEKEIPYSQELAESYSKGRLLKLKNIWQ